MTAYDYATYGTLRGRVTEVSADTLAEDKGQRFYRLRIDIGPDSLSTFGRELVPGMTATADVILGKRTVLAYLVSPLFRFRDQALRDRR